MAGLGGERWGGASQGLVCQVVTAQYPDLMFTSHSGSGSEHTCLHVILCVSGKCLRPPQAVDAPPGCRSLTEYYCTRSGLPPSPSSSACSSYKFRRFPKKKTTLGISQRLKLVKGFLGTLMRIMCKVIARNTEGVFEVGKCRLRTLANCLANKIVAHSYSWQSLWQNFNSKHQHIHSHGIHR